MNYNEAITYIHSLGNFSLPAGLERIKKVLNALGNPQNDFKSIHIAGTNGKGSVSTFISSVLKKAGYKTGLFVSPYIIDFCERIQINGEYVAKSDLVRLCETVKNTEIPLTEFEFITAMAFLYFKEQKVDVLVCETGLGGRLDATNSLENKIATVITKIGLDHTAILGDTIEKIAIEKCGILRECPTVTSPCQCEKAFNVIKQNAQKLIVPELSDLVKINDTGNSFIYKSNEYSLSLLGDYQIENALVAIETVQNIGFDIPYEVIRDGLNEAFIPARNEIICKNPLVVLDGAHNPDGATVLSRELKKQNGNVTAIIGMMKDKDIDKFLKMTLPLCKNAVFVTVKDMPRSIFGKELLAKYGNLCAGYEAKSYLDAVKKATEISNGGAIFVFGSLYLASGIRPLLKDFFN